MSTSEIPIQKLKGQNYFRYLALLILYLSLIIAVMLFPYFGYLIILPVVASLVGMFSLRFPTLYLFSSGFALEWNSIFKVFSNREEYRYSHIVSLEFSKGYFNQARMMLQIALSTASYGGFSKEDQMHLTFSNGREKIIYRIGSRTEFEQVCEKLKRLSQGS